MNMNEKIRLTCVIVILCMLFQTCDAKACEMGDLIPLWESFNKWMAERQLEKEEEEKQIAPADAEPMDEDVFPFLGTYEITCYNDSGLMASGREVYSGAVGCNSLPIGTVIYIDGLGTFTVEDTGGMPDNVIDMWVPWSTEECYEFGRQVKDVYIVPEWRTE